MKYLIKISHFIKCGKGGFFKVCEFWQFLKIVKITDFFM